MVAYKSLVPNSNDINYKQQLADLYSRRTKIDVLIESLREYHRFRATRTPVPNPKLVEPTGHFLRTA
jgi:hypothetical protein